MLIKNAIKLFLFFILKISCAQYVHSDNTQYLLLGEKWISNAIDANEKNTVLDVNFMIGEEYSIFTEVLDPLCDGTIVVKDTSGFSTEMVPNFFTRMLLKMGEKKRRSPEDNWFFLLGYFKEDARNNYMPIGHAEIIKIEHNGKLTIFLNDHEDYYHNNKGTYRVHLTRVK